MEARALNRKSRLRETGDIVTMIWSAAMEWLPDSHQFGLIGAPIIALALSIWLVVDFNRTRRAIKRGDPIRVWYLDYPIYPGDPLYSYFALQRERPAIMLFVIVGLIILVLGGLAIFGAPPSS
jgi:hypothetical protein